MSDLIDQKEYLKKYLGIGKRAGDKKKKKKKVKAGANIKIIDDDEIASVSTNIPVEEVFAENEDAPQIVAVIDDRPPSLRIDDKTKSHLWVPIGGGGTDNTLDSTKLSVHSFKLEQKKHEALLPRQIKREKISPERSSRRGGSPTSDIVRIKQEDLSPPRNNETIDLNEDLAGHSLHGDRKKQDISPLRGQNRDSDLSPARKKYSDQSPPRKRYEQTAQTKNDGLSSLRPIEETEDLSPPRKQRDGDDLSSPRRRTDEDLSPPRKRNKGDLSTSERKKDGDISPPRRRNDEDLSPPRRRNNKDLSPPRRRNDKVLSPPRRRNDNDLSPPRRRNNEDLSPPRKRNNLSSPRKIRKDDASPLRSLKQEHVSPSQPRAIRSTNQSSRKQRLSPSLKKPGRSRWGSPSPPKSISKMTKTLDGKKAGLQNAKELVSETQQLKKKEEELFKNMSSEVSGVNAATISRDKSGRIRNFEEEVAKTAEKKQKEAETLAQYSKWGRGLKQVEDASAKLQEQLHEMSKPLARYADDEDLERYLKEQEREGDPMLAYIRKKKKKETVASGKPIKPQYEGEFMPNRFGIRPGHRWDGVDRSNGYEKKWFEVQNAKTASREEAYRWTSEDM